MKKCILFIVLIIIANGCAINVSTAPNLKTELNSIDLNKDSNISVITFIKANNKEGVGELLLAYEKDGELAHYPASNYKYFYADYLDGFYRYSKIYLCNLPPNTYYILMAKATEEYNMIANKIYSEELNSAEDQFEKNEMVFNKEFYIKCPLKIEPNSFNLLGDYKIRKWFFITNPELSFYKSMDPQEEIDFFKTHIAEDSIWNDMITNNVVINEIPKKKI